MERPMLHSEHDLAPDCSSPENFARSAKWSPDGSAVLAQCENRSMQKLELSADVESEPSEFRAFQQAASILDYVWFPGAAVLDPASYCFAASVRECPVKLLDASDGRLRASYPIVDHRERHVAPHSLAFNCTADKLYCGFEDAIEVFDVQRPGEGTRLHTTPSKKSKDGLKGIISTLAFSNSYPFYAAGTFSPGAGNVALYSETEGETPITFIGGGTTRPGITQLAFSPTQPHMLYASCRRRQELEAWDLRGDVDVPVEVLRIGSGGDMTNQRMRFDVDPGGRRLAVGDQKGSISVFTLGTGGSPSLTFSAHGDSVGSVSFNPCQPLLISVSGSRHFEEDERFDRSIKIWKI